MSVNSNEIEQVIVLYPIDNLEIEFKVENFFNSEVIWRKSFMDENCRCWGEYYEYHENGHIRNHGFCNNNIEMGIWTYYNEDGSVDEISFFSFETPGKNIDENEYKRQLAKIRLGIWKVPVLDLKISDYEY